MNVPLCRPGVILLAAIWLLVPSRAQDYGLESPVAIGGFLDGVLPVSTPGPTGSWELVDVFPNLSFVDPVRVVPDPLDPEMIFVVCRNGEIWKLPDDPSADSGDRVRFLDRRSQTWGYWDSGMMSLTFHPEFGQPGSPNRGYCYVFYQYSPSPSNSSTTNPSYMRLSRFNVPDGADRVDSSSEYVLIQQYDRHNWHNGGQTFFGADGFLYVVVGDEGAANDSYNVAQKIDERLFSGILRIDVDQNSARSHPIRRQPETISRPNGWPASFTQGYFIPDDNPWVDESGGVLEEFWTIGLRSPHSMHYDRASGNIWIAEVGQGAREEVTVARRGGNHQWPYKEGSIDGSRSRPSSIIGTENPPIHDYPRSEGGCVIGGIVYRGTEHAGTLTGKYIFGDHNSRRIWALTPVPGEAPRIEYLTSVFRSGGTKRGLSGISANPDGECYICEMGNTGTETGKIFRLSRSGASIPEPPGLLSETDAFTDLTTLEPRPGLLPYTLNAPLWSDNAEKRRWIAVPNDGSHDTLGEQIRFREEENWDFPVGTVMVKHFELPIDERDPSLVRRLETRFLVKGTDDQFYGVTYRWNEEGTDAVLLHTGAEESITVTQANGSQREQEWIYPSRSDCLSCHTSNGGQVLGLRTHQLNREQYFPETDRNDNILRAWNHIGLFSPALDESAIPGFLQAARLEDTSRPLLDRVRSWLDSNCAHCHQPGGAEANFDARYTTPLAQQNLIHGSLRGSYTATNPLVVSPGDLTRSILYQRDNSLGDDAMPPLAKNLVHTEAMALMAEWIGQLDSGAAAPLIGEYFDGRNFGSLLLTKTENKIDFDWGRGDPAPEVDGDTFSVRWTGTVVPEFSETYRFYTETDDGVRLWINDQLLVNRWNDQSAREYSGTIALTAGVPATLRMEYYENGGNAVARLSWSSPRTPKTIIPPSAFAAAGGEPPLVVLETAESSVDGPFDVSLTFSKPVSGLVASELLVSNGRVSALTGQDSAYLLRIIPDDFGTLSISLPAGAAFDANGRGNEASNEIDVVYGDQEPPSLVLAAGVTVVSEAFEVSADFSEPVQGFDAGDVTVVNGSVSDFSGEGASYTFIVTPESPGDVTISVAGGAAEDGGGNVSEASNVVVVDYVAQSQQIIRVYLLAGQSNMSGEGDLGDLPQALADPQTDVDFYYRIPGDADVFTSLQPGSSDGSDFGPELSFGRTMADYYQSVDPNVRVALIKFARGGSRLYADWVPGESEYVTFHEVVGNGLAQLASTYPDAAIEVAGFLWQQGEADALSGQAFSYANNLTSWISDIRGRFGADLPFIYGRLSSNQIPAIGEQEAADLRAAQESVDGLDTAVKMLDTDGIPTIETDVIHFDSEGLLDLGVAFAEGILSVNQVSLPETTVALGASSSTVFGTFNVELVGSRPLSGLVPDDFVVSNGAVSELTGISKNHVVTVAPTSPGEVTVRLPAGAVGDPLGGGNAESNTVSVTYSTGEVGDALEIVALPTTVRRGETAAVSINYQAAGLRDVQIILHDSLEGWRVDASHFAQVAGGTGSIVVDLPVSPTARMGDGYLWAVRLIPVGSDFTEAVAEFYLGASMEENTTGILTDSIAQLRAPSEVERGETVVVEMDYEAADTRDVELLLQDSQNNWATVGSAPAQVEAGSGTLVFNITIAGNGRVGDGYVWVNRLLPVGGDNSQAVAESYLNASVLPASEGGVLDLINDFSAPSTVHRAAAATVRVDYEASTDRDLNVVLLDSVDGWRVVGEARSPLAAGVGSQEFTIGIAGDGRIGEGYVWVAQLIPTGATDGSGALDEKYVGAAMAEETGEGTLVNYAVLPEAMATQSSVFGSYFTADLARDGNTDGDWRNGSVTHTELDSNPWWEIDLGASKELGHVFVWNRTDCCAERLRDFYVLVSEEPFVSKDLDLTIAQPGVRSVFVSGTPEPTAEIAIGQAGRYVRVQMAEEGYLSLAEVEVFGDLGGGTIHGLTYQYYEGVWDALPDFAALAARKTGTVENVDLTPRMRDDYFAFRFRGCLIVPAAGDYTFYTRSDAGSRLLVGGQVVVDNDGDHEFEEQSGTVSLLEGMHLIEVQYFEKEGEEGLTVSWEGPGFPREAIPDASLSVNETRVSPTFRFALPQLSSADNADGDLLDLAAELALGQNPGEGVYSETGLRFELSGDAVHVYYDRPPALSEFSYVLEGSADLETWFDILGAEIVTQTPGIERVRYRMIHLREPLSAARGFIRLRIEHAAWGHVSHTPICGWQGTPLDGGYQSYGSAFTPNPVFGSVIASATETRLIAVAGGLDGLMESDSRYYAEFSSGDYQGHRVRIDPDSSTDQSVALDLLAEDNTLEEIDPGGVIGDTFIIYEHDVLVSLFPKDRFTGSNHPGLADQVLFFDEGKYEAYFLLDVAGRYHWAEAGDDRLLNQDAQVVPPGRGAFIRRHSVAAETLFLTSGHIRTHAFVQPLNEGYNLVAPGFPLWQTPLERGLTSDNGFLGALDPSEADQILAWDAELERFQGLFLLDDGQTQYWTPLDDVNLENHNETPWFSPDGAVFLRLAREPHPDYRILNPLSGAVDP